MSKSNLTFKDGSKMDEAKAQSIIKEFWGRSDRKQNTFSEREIKPDQFHNWGEMATINERSPILRNLISAGGVSKVNNLVVTFEAIMKELDLKFEVIPMTTFKPKDATLQKHAVIYEVHSVPRWTFRGLGSSNQRALEMAAKNGIEFLIVMAS